MGYLIEPKGIYLTVSPEPLSEEERKRLSEIIANYRATGRKPRELPKSVVNKKSQPQKAKD